MTSSSARRPLDVDREAGSLKSRDTTSDSESGDERAGWPPGLRVRARDSYSGSVPGLQGSSGGLAVATAVFGPPFANLETYWDRTHTVESAFAVGLVIASSIVDRRDGKPSK